jgi:hypothetical protein
MAKGDKVAILKKPAVLTTVELATLWLAAALQAKLVVNFAGLVAANAAAGTAAAGHCWVGVVAGRFCVYGAAATGRW